MKASPQAQLKLLELADLDAELGRLDHRRRMLPESQEYERAQARDAELRDELATLEAQQSDMSRDQGKAERDVDQVRSRIERDRARLDAGLVSSPKELENLPSVTRSTTKYALLDPHVRQTIGLGADFADASRISINAGSYRHTSYMLDGVSTYDWIYANSPQTSVSPGARASR